RNCHWLSRNVVYRVCLLCSGTAKRVRQLSKAGSCRVDKTRLDDQARYSIRNLEQFSWPARVYRGAHISSAARRGVTGTSKQGASKKGIWSDHSRRLSTMVGHQDLLGRDA